MYWNFQEKNPGLSRRRGNPVQIYWNILEHITSLFTDFGSEVPRQSSHGL